MFSFLLLRRVLSTASLWLPLSGYAQANFQPGYVVMTPSDTLRGEVDLRDVRFNSETCRFRPTRTEDSQLFAATEIVSYEVAGRVYRAVRLPRPTFAEEIVKGPLDLLFRVDSAKAEHFYLPPLASQTTVEELRRPMQRTVRNGQLLIRADEEFQRQLVGRMGALGSSCLPAASQVAAWRLTYSSLRFAVAEYGRCQHQPVRLTPTTRATVSLLAGGLAMRYPTEIEDKEVAHGALVPSVSGELQLMPVRLTTRAALALAVTVGLKRPTFRGAYSSGGPSPSLVEMYEQVRAWNALLLARRFLVTTPRVRCFAEAGVGITRVGIDVREITEFDEYHFRLRYSVPTLAIGAGLEAGFLRVAVRGTTLFGGLNMRMPMLSMLVGVRLPGR